ncbi:MAG: hypothetical protein L0099_07225 [Acidobacteria bacterium]|nr:hypothetical protein [Acidobacteriota bacterium]
MSWKIEDFRQMREYLWEAAKAEYDRKAKDYTSRGSELSSFDDIANMTGSSPEFVWGVLLAKHLRAVLRWSADGVLHSESFKSRAIDVINYMLLGYALAERRSHPVQDLPESPKEIDYES